MFFFQNALILSPFAFSKSKQLLKNCSITFPNIIFAIKKAKKDRFLIRKRQKIGDKRTTRKTDIGV